MQNRFQRFSCHAIISKLKDADACAMHLCSWICQGAAERDAQEVWASSAVMAAATAPNSGDAGGNQLIGMAELVAAAKLPEVKAAALQAELLTQGAVHVQELTTADWEALQSWCLLLSFEKRRLLTWFATK